MPIGTPSVPYRLPGSQYERWVDIYTRLGAERILFLGQEVNDGIANSLVAQMLYLDSEDSSNFDTVLNELSDDTQLIENTEEQLIEKEVNNIDNNLIENGQSSIENIEDIKKTSIPLFFKNITILPVMDYYKPDTITNNLSIPKLPTEEDLLDELLDSVLSPSD